MTRFIALCVEPLEPGTCPSCDGILDDSGCRIAKACAVVSDPRNTGIRFVYAVDCAGEPAHPVRPCPACAERAG